MWPWQWDWCTHQIFLLQFVQTPRTIITSDINHSAAIKWTIYREKDGVVLIKDNHPLWMIKYLRNGSHQVIAVLFFDIISSCLSVIQTLHIYSPLWSSSDKDGTNCWYFIVFMPQTETHFNLTLIEKTSSAQNISRRNRYFSLSWHF